MRWELKVLLASSSLFTLAGGLFGPIYAVFVEEIGGDLFTAGTAYGVFAIVTGILMLLISRWEDRVKHLEKFVVLGYALSCLGYLGYVFVSRPWHLFLVQAVFGLGSAIGTPAYDGLYSRYLDKDKYASEWGVWEAMYWIVTAIAAMVGGYLVNSYASRVTGFRTLFGLMFLISLVGFLISLFLFHRKRRSRA